jgi:uncharacterized membrane protein
MVDVNTSDAPVATLRTSEQPDAAGRPDDDTVAQKTVTINRPRQELYAYWRDFSNLATFMDNIESITVRDDRTSHWVVKAPGGGTVEWDAIVTADEPGRRIAWESAPGADVSNSGVVEFKDAQADRGTLVSATIAYDPPGGAIGEFIAKLFQREPALQARRELRRFKQLMETGEISTPQRYREAPEHGLKAQG